MRNRNEAIRRIPVDRDRAEASSAFEAAVRNHLSGDHAKAEHDYRRTIQLAPKTAEAHNNLGVLLKEKNPAEALELFTTAVRLAPDYADGLLNRGLALQRIGRSDEALVCFEAVTKKHPENAKGHTNLGLTLLGLDRLDEALAPLERARTLEPKNPGSHTNLGNFYLRQAEADKAISYYEEALRLHPENVEALNNLGSAYRSRRNFPAAIRFLRKALEINPDFLDALHNLSLALPPSEASATEIESILRYAAERNADDPAYRGVLATGLQEAGKIDEAMAEAERVLEMDPDSIAAWNVMAIGSMHHREFDRTIECCERVLGMDPRNTTALWNRALARLALGDYERGWKEYESRWKLVHFGLERRIFEQPEWDGSSLDGRTILLYTEQGLGDGLQFIRFGKLLKDRWNVRIVIESAAPLASLFRTIDWVDDVVLRKQDHPAFDVHAPLLSLPRLLEIGLDDLPAEAYIPVSPRPIIEKIRDTGALRVGLVWGGGTPTPTLAWRSLKLDNLKSLFEIPNVDFYSLQMGDAAAELEASPLASRITDLAPEIHDFTDTAAAIAELDLVISIDTSVAHLAGGIGAPVWVPLIRSSDWRWLSGRSDSPWYPSARLFRQPEHGDWNQPIKEVRAALESLAAGRNVDDARPSDGIENGPVISEEMTTDIPAIQTLANGKPRFTLSIPMAVLATGDNLGILQQEMGGEGVEPELRRFLDDVLRNGDAFIDLQPGWGFSALAAATIPNVSAVVIARSQSSENQSILNRAANANRLTGSLSIRDPGEASIDPLLPINQLGKDRLLVLRSSPDELLTGGSAWLASGRIGAFVWPAEMSTATDFAPAEQRAFEELNAADFLHLQTGFDEEGPVLLPAGAEGTRGPVISVSPALANRESDEVAEPAANNQVDFVGPGWESTPRLGIDWQIGSNSGWGVYGLNLVRRSIETRGAFPVLFTPPSTSTLNPDALGQIEPALAAHRILTEAAAAPGSTIQVNFPVLRGLGNRLMSGSNGLAASSSSNVGVVFFEDTALDAAALQRGKSYERIIAGSTWNAEVLRGSGLDNVELCLQGIDPSLFKPARPTGAFGDRFVVFAGGKLEYRKGQDLVVAAFREFHRRHPDSVLVFAWHNHWPGTMREISLRGHVDGTPGVDANGVIDFTSWLRDNDLPLGSFGDLGQLTHDAMGRVIAEASVALFPNRCEGGTNLVAMECMAAGIPTILSANTGHLDLIDGENSFALTRQGQVTPTSQFPGTEGWGESDVDEIVEALEAAYSGREEAKARGARGARTLGALTWDNQIDTLLGILADLLPTPDTH